MQKYEIIIVGAGPAGLATALYLAKWAPALIPDILILEKGSHPRGKVCGGGILPDGEMLLQALGLDIGEIPHVDVSWAHFDFRGRGTALRAEKNGAWAFRIIRRDLFDAWLAGKARQRGIRILEDTAVRQVLRQPQGVTLVTDREDFRARVVVGADGAGSIIRRAIIHHEPLHLARTLEVMASIPAERTPGRQADAFFDFGVLPQGIRGYAWDFPAVGDGMRMLGVYDSNIRRSPNPHSLAPALADELKGHGLNPASHPPKGAPIRWFRARNAFAAEHILLAGDAAGVDVLLGEGISFALGYGALAAQTIQAAYASGDFSFNSYRKRILRSEMGKALRRRAGLAWIFFRFRISWFQSLLWRHLGGWVAWIARRWLLGWAARQEKVKQGKAIG